MKNKYHPSLRRNHTAELVGNDLVIMLGINESNTILNDVYSLNLSSQEGKIEKWNEVHISKETPEYFNQIFHCNLETLVFNGNNLYETINYLDPKNANVENLMKTFITQNPKLNTLVFCDNNFNKYFLDSLAESLREKNNIKYLSFSNSKIDGEKFKSLLPIFYAPLEKQKDEKNEIKEKNEKKDKKKD